MSTNGKVALDVLERAIEGTLAAEPQMVAAWKEEWNYFGLVRNMRNVCEHPNNNYKISLSDFSMLPTGEINPPLVEIQHPTTPIKTLPSTEFLVFVRNAVLEHAEDRASTRHRLRTPRRPRDQPLLCIDGALESFVSVQEP